MESATSVQNWATGAVLRVPPPVVTLVEFMLDQPLMRPWFEKRRPPNAGSKPRTIRRKSQRVPSGKLKRLNEPARKDTKR